MRHPRRSLVLATATVSFCLLGTGVASATTGDTADRALESPDGAIELVEPSVLDGAVTIDAGDLTDGEVTVAAGSGTVTVPADASDGLQLETRDGAEVTVDLPFAAVASDGLATDSGVVAYDNGNDTSTVPVVKEDGGVQITTTIASSDAPERFVYGLDIPSGATLQQFDSGAVFVLDANGALIVGAAPPWAKDAAGMDVPTWYEIDGTQLVQVVVHRTNRSVTYPVVADPFLGADLFSWTGYNRNGTYLGQTVISMLKSTWGNAVWLGGVPTVGTIAAGQYILQTSGWNELVAKRPVADDKPSIQQQYDCHVLYGFNIAGAGVHWDLEKARSNNSVWALQDPRVHKCNW